MQYISCVCVYTCLYISYVYTVYIHICMCVYIQLTLEQHRFELRGSIYTWIFFNKYVLHSQRLVESIDAELWIQRASCTDIHRLQTAWRSEHQTPALFKGQLCISIKSPNSSVSLKNTYWFNAQVKSPRMPFLGAEVTLVTGTLCYPHL